MESYSLIQWTRKNFQAWHQARLESRFVNGINRELLELHHKISAGHPQLSDRERFNKLVMMRNGCDEIAAYEVIRNAEDSYAAWPLERELTLCDVIHYLAVREFHAKQADEYSMGVNIAARVKAIVPSKLCCTRLKQPYLCERRKILRTLEEG
jgi:hypothetical protein